MKIEISIAKDGKILAEEVITNPPQGELAAAIGRVFDRARQKSNAPIWDCQIGVRQME